MADSTLKTVEKREAEDIELEKLMQYLSMLLAASKNFRLILDDSTSMKELTSRFASALKSRLKSLGSNISSVYDMPDNTFDEKEMMSRLAFMHEAFCHLAIINQHMLNIQHLQELIKPLENTLKKMNSVAELVLLPVEWKNLFMFEAHSDKGRDYLVELASQHEERLQEIAGLISSEGATVKSETTILEELLSAHSQLRYDANFVSILRNSFDDAHSGLDIFCFANLPYCHFDCEYVDKNIDSSRAIEKLLLENSQASYIELLWRIIHHFGSKAQTLPKPPLNKTPWQSKKDDLGF